MTARRRIPLLVPACALAVLITAAAKRTPLAQAAPMPANPCLATVTSSNVETEHIYCSGPNYAYLTVKVNFTCSAGDGSGATECGTWGNWSYATGTTSTGPWTPQTITPPPQPVLSRTYSCGINAWDGFDLRGPNMVLGTYYQITMTFGAQNAQGQGGGNGTNTLVVVVDC